MRGGLYQWQEQGTENQTGIESPTSFTKKHWEHQDCSQLRRNFSETSCERRKLAWRCKRERYPPNRFYEPRDYPSSTDKEEGYQQADPLLSADEARAPRQWFLQREPECDEVQKPASLQASPPRGVGLEEAYVRPVAHLLPGYVQHAAATSLLLESAKPDFFSVVIPEGSPSKKDRKARAEVGDESSHNRSQELDSWELEAAVKTACSPSGREEQQLLTVEERNREDGQWDSDVDRRRRHKRHSEELWTGAEQSSNVE